MIGQTQRDFDPQVIIADHLVTPTKVTTDGLLGGFDTLRVALEHLQTHGTANTLLAIQVPGEEHQYSGEALAALVEAFATWLYNAGLPSVGER